MHVAVAGPVATRRLLPHLDHRGRVPPGLGSTSLTRLVCGLLDRGVRLSVVTCAPSVPTVAEEVVAEGPGLRLRVGPFRPAGRARDGFRVERAYVREALRDEAPDLVHAHWTYEYALGALAWDAGALVTFRDWAPTVLRYHPHPYRVVRLAMQVRVLQRARAAVAISPYLARRVRRWFRGPVTVIPNGLEEAAFDPAPRALHDRQEPRLIAVNSGFGARKNVGSLLRAFALVRTRRPRCRLALVGDGYGPAGPAQAWARRRGLTAGVEFHGRVPPGEVRELMRAADVLVHPSREETFGNVLLEAMAQGLPVIGGRRSGAVPWVLGGGSAGLLTDVTHPPTLAAAALGLLADPDGWSRLSRAGYRRAWERFRLSRVVDGHLDLYARLASGEAA